MKVIPFNREYERGNFDCGKSSLNNYILRNASNDVKNNACACFVILNIDQKIVGYYTLSTDSIPKIAAPIEYQKKVNYSYIPVILLGRLAIDKTEIGKGYGKLLLIDSLKRSLEVVKGYIGAVVVIVDPIDIEATSFYSKYGFILLPTSGKMFMSISKIFILFQE